MPTTVAAQSADPFAQATYHQPSYQQPLYQWTNLNAQPAQAVRRVVMRHRAVKKVAPAAQPGVTGATAAGVEVTPY
jgi:hypothetical protein